MPIILEVGFRGIPWEVRWSGVGMVFTADGYLMILIFARVPGLGG